MIDKLNPVAKVAKAGARWLGYGGICVLYGAIVASALRMRSHARRPIRRNVLDLAVITAGLLGLVALGDRALRRRPPHSPDDAPDGRGDRFSHPALNVQRISFA